MFLGHNTHRKQAGCNNSISSEVSSKSNPSYVIFKYTVKWLSQKLAETQMNTYYKIKYILKEQQKVPVKATKITTGWRGDYIRMCWQDQYLSQKTTSLAAASSIRMTPIPAHNYKVLKEYNFSTPQSDLANHSEGLKNIKLCHLLYCQQSLGASLLNQCFLAIGNSHVSFLY